MRQRMGEGDVDTASEYRIQSWRAADCKSIGKDHITASHRVNKVEIISVEEEKG